MSWGAGMVIVRIVPVWMLAVALVGCAQAPDLRSVAYAHLGSNVVLIKPIQAVPPAGSGSYATNDYFGMPGTVFLPTWEIEPFDDINQRSAVWAVLGAQACEPLSYRLNDTAITQLDDIMLDYVLDDTVRLLPIGLTDASYVKRDFPGLPKNVLGKLRRITIVLRNLKVHAADAYLLARGLSDARSDRCFERAFRRSKAFQIERVYTAEYDTHIETTSGADVSALFLKARVEESFRYRIRGPAGRPVFFAITARRL